MFAARLAITGRKISCPVAPAGGEDAHHQAAPGHEPAVGDGGREDHGHRAGAEPDQQAPGQHQLPALVDEDGQPAAGRDQQQREAGHLADAEPVHQRGGERGHQPVQDQVDADRAGHQGPRPAELLLQRHHQTPGAARKPAAPTRATNATTATHQAGWIPVRVARRGQGVRTPERACHGATASWPDGCRQSDQESRQICG